MKKNIICIALALFCLQSNADNLNSGIKVISSSFSQNSSTGATMGTVVQNLSGHTITLNYVYAYYASSGQRFWGGKAGWTINNNEQVSFDITNSDMNSLFTDSWIIRLMYTNNDDGQDYELYVIRRQGQMSVPGVLDDVTYVYDAIEFPTVDESEGDNRIYNLQGQIVEHPAKGIYIVNGKKVYFKGERD